MSHNTQTNSTADWWNICEAREHSLIGGDMLDKKICTPSK